MYKLKAAVEQYAAFHDGKYPTSIQQIEEFFEYPVNPYTGKPLPKYTVLKEGDTLGEGDTLVQIEFLKEGDTLKEGDVYIKFRQEKVGDSLVIKADTFTAGYVLKKGEVYPRKIIRTKGYVLKKGETYVKCGIKLFTYFREADCEDRDPKGINGQMRGKPGYLAYGYYAPRGKNYAISYGILGFDEKGEPLKEKGPGGKDLIIVLYPERE